MTATITKLYVKYDSTDYTLLKFNLEKETGNKIDAAKISIAKINVSAINIGNDVSVGYYSGANFIVLFNGDIVDKETGDTTDCTVESYGGRLNRSDYFSDIYTGVSPEHIVEDILDNQVPTLTYASSTSSGITIDRFVIKNETPMEAITRLLTLLNWQLRTDNNKNLYFEPVGTTINSNIITIGYNAYLDGAWSESPNSLVNTVTVIGGSAIFNTDESFTATSSQTVFTLTNKIVGNLKATDNAAALVGGVDGGTGVFDYTFDADNKTVTFEVGRTSGHTIIITYDYQVPIKVTAIADSSITTNTKFSQKVTDNTIKTMGDARRRAKQILNEGKVTKSSTLIVNYGSSYNVGETVQIIDSFNSINQNAVVNKVSFNYPEGSKKIEVGNAKNSMLDWNKNLNTRLKNLESAQDNSDRIQLYKSIQANINVVAKSGRTRVRSDTIGNSWICGSSTNGIVGVNTATQGGSQQVVGGSSRVVAVQSVSNYSDLFRERFNFTTFIDSVNTTATVNVATEDCDLTTGEILQSLSCQKGETITKATLTSDSTTNLTFQMSANAGINWETVTSGTEHTFTNTGTDLRYKCTASGNATISLLTISYE